MSRAGGRCRPARPPAQQPGRAGQRARVGGEDQPVGDQQRGEREEQRLLQRQAEQGEPGAAAGAMAQTPSARASRSAAHSQSATGRSAGRAASARPRSRSPATARCRASGGADPDEQQAEVARLPAGGGGASAREGDGDQASAPRDGCRRQATGGRDGRRPVRAPQAATSTTSRTTNAYSSTGTLPAVASTRSGPYVQTPVRTRCSSQGAVQTSATRGERGGGAQQRGTGSGPAQQQRDRQAECEGVEQPVVHVQPLGHAGGGAVRAAAGAGYAGPARGVRRVACRGAGRARARPRGRYGVVLASKPGSSTTDLTRAIL